MSFLSDELHILAEEIASARQDILFSDTFALSNIDATRKRAARIKTLALIQLAASFERFLSKSIEKLNIEISNKKIKISHIKTPLLSLALNEAFNSVRDTEGDKSISKRVQLLELSNSEEETDLSHIKSSTIYGGKTPRKKHIGLIWTIYAISHPLPSPQLLIALDSLADSRNEIVHGEITTTLAGRKKTTNDILSLAEKISDLSIYITQCLQEYIKTSSYNK